MTLQAVRGAMATLTADALVAGGMAADRIYWQNVQESPPADGQPWAMVTISFPRLLLPTIGCRGQDAIRGTCLVRICWPKQQGTTAAEALALEVVKAWCGTNEAIPAAPAGLRTKLIEGPVPLPLTESPWAVFVVNCSFSGRG